MVWSEVVDEASGVPYYYNDVTGETTWERPAAPISAWGAAAAAHAEVKVDAGRSSGGGGGGGGGGGRGGGRSGTKPKWSTWGHNVVLLAAVWLVLAGIIDSVWAGSYWKEVRDMSSRGMFGCLFQGAEVPGVTDGAACTSATTCANGTIPSSAGAGAAGSGGAGGSGGCVNGKCAPGAACPCFMSKRCDVSDQYCADNCGGSLCSKLPDVCYCNRGRLLAGGADGDGGGGGGDGDGGGGNTWSAMVIGNDAGVDGAARELACVTLAERSQAAKAAGTELDDADNSRLSLCEARPAQAGSDLCMTLGSGVGILGGAAIAAFEVFWGLPHLSSRTTLGLGRLSAIRFPLRASVYLVVAAALMASLSVPMCVGATFLALGAVIFFVAAWKNELKPAPRARRRGGGGGKDGGKNKSFLFAQQTSGGDGGQRRRNPVTACCVRAWEEDRFGQYFVVTLYFLLNLGIGVEAAVRWDLLRADVTNRQGKRVLSVFGPMAKTFGQLLNFNCSLLLVPVARNILRAFNHCIKGRHGGERRCSKFMLRLIPLSKNIAFHKLVAKVMSLCAVGHMFGHGMNYAINPDVALLFTSYSWATGVLITVSMFIIFSAATTAVKHAHFEIFWWAHHFFIVFFVCLFAHGKVFYQWALLPVLLYIAERFLRYWRGIKRVAVRRVDWIKPVMAIEFRHEHGLQDFPFVEGQYVYLNCPVVSKHEWHPFTISSAVGDLELDNYVSCHIRVHPGGWTEKVKDVMSMLNPKDDWPVDFSHRDQQTGGAAAGKYLYLDGKTPLLRVDGPHPAPAMHYVSYDRIVIIGAGIGLTPCNSVLRAVLKHKWRKGFNPRRLTFCWVVRQAELKSFRWFIETLTALEHQLLTDRHTGAVPNSNVVDMHIFVTGVSRQTADGGAPPTPKRSYRATHDFQSWEEKNRDARAVSAAASFVPAWFTADDLARCMVLPPAKSTDFARIMRGGPELQQSVALQDIYCWDGRPQWNQVFATLKAEAQAARPARPAAAAAAIPPAHPLPPGISAAPPPRQFAAGSTGGDGGGSATEIGVCFCGAPVIGKDLRKACTNFSSLDDRVIFKLHKENF